MRRLVAAGFGVLLLFAGCAGGENVTGERRNVGGVTVTFRVEPSRVSFGQAVRLTLRLVNNTGTAERLTFPSGQKYDFWVTRDAEEIWRWSADLAFTQAITEQTIEGQSGTTFDESWTTEERGSLTVHGELQAEGYGGPFSAEIEVE